MALKNPVYHSKTKYIEIRHHFIRDCYEKKLISVEKIHKDLNVADLLTKPFDGPRFNYLVVSIGFAEIAGFSRGGFNLGCLNANPTIYDSLNIDTIRYTISEASIRDSLQLEDATGITMLPNDDLFEGMGQIGYPTDGTFTFWKSFFTPQWRFLVHHLLHCISSKSGGWDQFGSNIATALICLSTDEHIYEEQSPVHHHFSPPQEQAPSQMPMDDLLHEVPKLISRIDSLETDLKQTKLTMGNAIVKLVKKVKKLEGFLKRRNLVLSDSEEEEPEVQGRKSQDDPLDSSVQGLVYSSLTKVNYLGEDKWKNNKSQILLTLISSAKSYTAEGVNTGSIKLSTFSEQLSTGNEQVSTVGTKESTSSQDKGQREGKAPMLKEEELNEQQKKRKAQVQFEAQHYTNEDWDLIRAKIEANAELSKSMLGSELQGEDFAKKMVDLVNQRRRTWKLSQLKKLSFEEVKEEFDKLVKQVESFAPINFEATKAGLKRFGEELQTKTPKRLKDDEDVEAKDDEPTRNEVGEQEESATGTKTPINPVPVAMKTPSIATYKIIKQGEKGVYQIVREDGTDVVYINFGAMLKSISRDDLTELYRIVMNRYGMDGPEDKLEKGFWKCLRTMFEEPLSTDSIWSELGQQKIISWRYYDTCRVHCLNLESMDVYMLSERKYPLSAEVCQTMLKMKLLDGKMNEDCYRMLKMMEKQAGVNTPGSDENRLKLYDLMYIIVNVADMMDCPVDQILHLPPLFVLVIKHVLRSNTSKRLSGSFDDCKSTLGGLQFLGEKLVSWSSKKQDCTAMSTTKAEYVSLFVCCAQVIWMQTQLLDYGYKYNIIPMYYDSKSVIAISCNPVQHSRTKHIDIHYHFIKEHFEKGTMELYFVGTEYQLADLFTKALSKERFEYLVYRIGMRCMTPTQLKSLAKLSS
ncbi:hypothetical protein Tco_1003985 [Tanacetum coccineum]|uniref:Uncharacterized protein n=1 Tax=Tanacetum coccineum TaxID=301880 RepID=A0ABQ5FB47_9ASTR